jgi:DNA-binding HxlR family transcriptional regulator
MDCSCTVYKTMDYLSRKWAIMILLELYKEKGSTDGWKRFSQIGDGMKEVTPKILTERLHELESEGVIEHRVIADSFPVRSEYRLSQSGLELMAVVHELKMWALKWKIDNEPCKHQDCVICIL